MKNTIVPADGIKGKTWGPSTLHQRARSNLPVLAQTTTQKPTPFSKSAPNLDKTRVAGNDSPTNASTSHSNFLGKSVDALNMIKSGKSNSNYSNTTKLGHNDSKCKYNRYDRRTKSYRNIGDVEYEDDGDDTAEAVGCFSFISGGKDDTLMKRKKHSLDSKMTDTAAANSSANNALPLQVAVKTIGIAAYAQEIDVDGRDDAGDDDDDNNNIDDGDESLRPYSNYNNVIYDSLFYKNIQKSLDDISIGCQQRQQYLPFEESHFDRACFFVEPSNEHENDNDNDNDDSSFDAGASTTQEMSQKSIDLSTDDNIYQDEQTTHSSTETPASMSRKNSVTFRDDDDDSAQYSILSDTSEDSITVRKMKVMGHYAIISQSRLPNANSNQTTLNSDSNSNVRISNLSNVSQKVSNPMKKDWKEKKSYMSWNILGRKKGPKAEINEQLLDDDSMSSKYYTQV